MNAQSRCFTLCDYFNKQGTRIERVYLANEPGEAAVQRIRAMDGVELERCQDAMLAEANASRTVTSLEDAALALNVLLNEVAEDRWPLARAREVSSIGINFCEPLSVSDIAPVMGASFGAYADSWVHGIFRHLNPH